MKLDDFEKSIEPAILERGSKLFAQGAVIQIAKKENNRIVASVRGTRTYSVEIFQKENREISQSSCTCPFDWSEICKHQAAVYYALREDVNPLSASPSDATPESKLKQNLMQESKEELVSILLKLAKQGEEIENQLLLRYASPEEEISQAKAIIREYIKGATSRGFIHWNRMCEALTGASMVLESAEQKIERGRYVDAVKLSIEIMPPVVAMLQYADDSGGDVTYITSKTMETIRIAINIGLDNFSSADRNDVFKTVLKEAKNKRYDGWDDWRFDLLEAIVPFGKDPKLRAIFEKELDALYKKIPQDSWRRNYSVTSIKEIQLQLLEVSGAEDSKIDAFINENLSHSKFREKAVQRAMERQDYESAESLCHEGEKSDQDSPGLVHQWKDYRYQIYENIGDIARQRSLAFGLVTSYKEYKDYLRLKELYSSEDWPEILEKLLIDFEKKEYYPDLYVTILLEENFDERLLAYTLKHKSRIIDLYPYLIEQHFTEVNKLFVKTIEDEAEAATERKKYRNVCRTIKKYKSACGEVNSRKLIEELMSKYPRRPAFLDELHKIK